MLGDHADFGLGLEGLALIQNPVADQAERGLGLKRDRVEHLDEG